MTPNPLTSLEYNMGAAGRLCGDIDTGHRHPHQRDWKAAPTLLRVGHLRVIMGAMYGPRELGASKN